MRKKGMAPPILSWWAQRPERSPKEDDLPICYLVSIEGHQG